MPMEYTWRAIGTAEGELLANKKLDKMRSLHVYTNNKNKRCSICKENTDGHKMRYKMWYCVSSTCNTSGEKCPYWLKLLQCLATDIYSFYEHENHLANVGSPKERVFTLAMKTQSRTMITDGVKPARIRNSLIDQFSMDRSSVPELKTIQNFVYNYKRSTLMNTDFVDDVISLANESRYSPELDDWTPFSFGYKLDNDGNPVLGEGNDEDPFILAFSTKYMLRQLNRSPGEFVFHMDATFKLTTKEFPLFVCGISDASRHFHCVALFITSQRTHVQYAAALNAISSQFCEVVGRSDNVTYFMGDAEEAQLNGFEESIGVSTDCDYLMCFFHVISNVKKRLSGISEQSTQIIFRDIYDLHYSRNADEYESTKTSALVRWNARSDLADFTSYFEKQWLSSRFNKWQCFRSPCGFAKTNNPAETFNKMIKWDYSLHVRLKMADITQKLLKLCRHQSVTGRDFTTAAMPSSVMVSRAKKLFNASLLLVSNPNCNLNILLADSTVSEDKVVVKSIYSATDAADAKKKGDVNERRMEHFRQPSNGWVVDIGKRSCNCSSYFKYAYCVHVLAALRSRNVTIPGWKGSQRGFVSRRLNRKRDTGEVREHNALARNDQTVRRSDPNRRVRGRGSGRGRGSSRGRRGRRFELDLETNGNEAPVGRPRRVQGALSFD